METSLEDDNKGTMKNVNPYFVKYKTIVFDMKK